MTFEKQLEKEKSVIVKAWFNEVLGTYPSDATQFFKNQLDPFANPVGNITLKNLDAIFQEMLNGMNHESLEAFLDPIIRIRAVQDFTPSQATGFITLLKGIIRKKFDKDLNNVSAVKALLEFETKIDTLNLIAFNIYMKCRETVYRIQANEEKNSTYSAFKRAGLLIDSESEKA